MLLDVLTRFAADSGFHPVQQRGACLSFLNAAGKEMHQMLECNAVCREITLVATGDTVVSIPAFVGDLRGMRMHTNEIPIDYATMMNPRYVSNTLQYRFKNWRDLGQSPIETYPTLVGQLSILANSKEDVPATLNIAGQTNNSFHDEEQLLLNQAGPIIIQTQKLFGPRIDSITCSSDNRIYDIRILDANGTELAILYNNQRQTRYKKIDISQLFWTQDTSAGETLVDVLYKLPWRPLQRDSDQFPAGDDYEEAWYQMSMFMFLDTKQDRKSEALAYRGAALSFINSAKNNSEEIIEKKISFGRGRFFGFFRRWRYYPGSVTNVDNNIQQ